MEMGIARLLEWKWERERFDGNGREREFHMFPFITHMYSWLIIRHC